MLKLQIDTTGFIQYHSTEQYLQCKKAEFAGDDVTAARIMKAEDPLECKNLAKSIKNFDVAAWDRTACDIMKQGLLIKFRTHLKCKETLMQTENRSLGEASKHDLFWGTGVALNDPHATNTGVWTGQNNMGKLLEEIRSAFN